MGRVHSCARRDLSALRRRAALLLILALALAGSPAGAAPPGVFRIVSMSPAATEALFALGLGDRVIGVTQYCDYPPEALSKPRVATLLDINLETLLSLSPDLVVLVDLNESLKERIERLGVRTFTLWHRSLGELCDSIEGLGATCGVPDQGRELADSLRGAMREARERTKGLSRPRVAVAVDRDVTDPTIRSIYIAGRASVYDEMIRLAGGANAFETEGVTYPRLSAEGFLGMDPDVIIDLVGDHSFQKGLISEDIRAQWRSLPELRAFQGGRIYIRFGNDALHPGPRLLAILRQFVAFIHPELAAAGLAASADLSENFRDVLVAGGP